MAYSLVDHVATSSPDGNDATTSSAINTTGASLLIMAIADVGGTTPVDSKSNTWVGLTAQSNVLRARLWYVDAPTVGAGHTFGTTSGGGHYPSIAIQAWSGSLPSPFDVENGALGVSATSLQTGSITPNLNNELVVAMFGIQDADTITVDSGMTITDQINLGGNQHYGVVLAYLIQTTAAAINPRFSFSVAQSPCATIGAFKAAAGAVTYRRPLITTNYPVVRANYY